MRAALRFASLAFVALVLVACASTPKLTASWRDPQFSGPPPAKLMVLGISRSDVHRRVFEDGFANALRSAGVGSIAAYTELPEQGVIPDERIQAAVKKSGADAVLTWNNLDSQARDVSYIVISEPQATSPPFPRRSNAVLLAR